MATTTNFTELYAEVMPELPDCPKPLILQTIRNVVRDFCERTRSWQCDL